MRRTNRFPSIIVGLALALMVCGWVGLFPGGRMPSAQAGTMAAQARAESNDQEPTGAAAPAAGVLVVDSVVVSGLVRMPPGMVLREAALQGLAAGASIPEDELASRSQALIRKLFEYGSFSDVRVMERRVGSGHLELTLFVLEQYKIDKILISGNKKVETEDIQKELDEAEDSQDQTQKRLLGVKNKGERTGLKRGMYFSSKNVMAALKAIEKLYQAKGFFLAETTYEVSRNEADRTVVITVRVVEQQEMEVRRVTFVGNKAFSDSELKGFMVTRENNYLTFLEKSELKGLFLAFYLQTEKSTEGGMRPADYSADLQTTSSNTRLDLERLRFLYMTRGYLDVTFGTPRISLTGDQTGMLITIPVADGPQYFVAGVDVMTEDPDGLLMDRSELLRGVKTITGEVFSVETSRQDIQGMTRRYRDKGYAFCNVSHKVSRDLQKRTAVITYVVEKGPPTYVANIILDGNKSTEDKVVRREMKISEGDLFKQTDIDRSKALVYRLGFFEKVEIDEKPHKGEPIPTRAGMPADVAWVDLVVSVKERETGIFNVGAGFSSLESYLLQARVSKNNFLGRGQTLSFQALLSSLRSIYMVSFTEPYFFDTLWNFSVELYNTSTDYEAFSTETIGGNVSFGYRFFDDYNVFLTYKLESMDTELGGRQGFSGVPLERLTSEGLTSSLRLSLAWDTRNNRIIPTEGFYHSISYEWASPYLGGDSNFTRTFLNSRWYVPLVWDITLRLNGTLGLIQSLTDAGVPLFERFYVGGIFSVRGFQRNSLSPTIPAASSSDPAASLVPFPLGGNKEIILNAELELPIVKAMNIVAVLFVDAGNAFAENEPMDVLALRSSWGVGVRWWSPMGPLRFEWGFPFNPLPGEDDMVFEFTIGSAF